MSDREAIYGGEPKPLAPYSPAIKAGGWVFASGQLASDFKTGLAPEATGNGENPNLRNSQALQSRFIMENLKKTLAAAGCDIATDVVRIYQWFASDYPTVEEYAEGNHWPRISITPYLDTRNEYIMEPRPASTGIGIRELLVKDCRLEVNLIAIESDKKVGPSVGTGVPKGIPEPLAGYSPAIRRGDWIFLAGDTATDYRGDFGRAEHWGGRNAVALDGRTNPYVWYGSSIEKQTDYTLQKLAAIAEAAGSSLSRAVKATVYIGHPQDFEGMDKVWRRWFPENPPARMVIPFTGLGLQGTRIEIAFKLLANDSKLQIETVEAPGVPPQMGHEPHAVKVGKFLFLSTQLPIDAKANVAAGTVRHPNFPYYGQPAKLQMRYILDNVEKVCTAAGTSLDQIVSRQAFHDDLEHFAPAMEEWAAHFPTDPPASTTMGVGGPLQVPGAHVLLDLIGYIPD
jgi:enamine deaminase RidA (YjgF/YER057c/UK114 family)